jgi:TM2 domain-containing membrane protein YozV
MASNVVPLSPKSWLATLLLSIFLGEFGIDRFYLGKIGTGILKLITLGGFGLWWLIDLILVIAGATKDKRGRLVKYQG